MLRSTDLCPPIFKSFVLSKSPTQSKTSPSLDQEKKKLFARAAGTQACTHDPIIIMLSVHSFLDCKRKWFVRKPNVGSTSTCNLSHSTPSKIIARFVEEISLPNKLVWRNRAPSPRLTSLALEGNFVFRFVGHVYARVAQSTRKMPPPPPLTSGTGCGGRSRDTVYAIAGVVSGLGLTQNQEKRKCLHVFSWMDCTTKMTGT